MNDEKIICRTWLHNEQPKNILCTRINRNEVGLELDPYKLILPESDKRKLLCFEGQLVSAGLGNCARVLYSRPISPIHCYISNAYVIKDAIEPSSPYRIEGGDVFQNMRRIFLLSRPGSFVIMRFDPKNLKPIYTHVCVTKEEVAFHNLVTW
jgi:hypothetical protein